MVVKSGYLHIGRIRGAPIRLHWTLPLVILLFTSVHAASTGWFHPAPGAWLGFVLIILVHELGHAAMVARAGQRIVAVDVLGFGGLCRWSGHVTPRQRVAIAWGGVIAQALLGACALAAVKILGRPSHDFTAELLDTFLLTNLELMLMNLLPVPPLDGVEAWGIVHVIRAERAVRRAEAERARVAAAKARAHEETSHDGAASGPKPRPPSEAMRTAKSLDDLDERELPPMPEEVKRVLDRVMAEGRAQHEAEKKKG